MSSQGQGDSSGSNSTDHKRTNQGRRGGHPNKAHHGRSPQTTAGAAGKDDTAQKRVRNGQQKSHDKTPDHKLRPQAGRPEHSREQSKATQRGSGSSGPAKSKGNPSHHKKTEAENLDSKFKKPSKTGENGLNSKLSTSKDIKRNERKDSGIGSSPPSIEHPSELESANTSVVEVPSAGPTERDGEEQERLIRTDKEETEGMEESKKIDNRIRYTRNELLALRESVASVERHPALTDFLDITFLKPPPLFKQGTESQLEGDTKRKHPTALSVIKEHDVRQLPKVSLSPQRKSFQSGCSWNDSKTQDTPPSSARDLSRQFEFEGPHQSPSKTNHGSFQQGPPPQSKHKVIDHIPLRDQEMGRGGKKNWREKSKEPEWAKDERYHTYDEEPEWMEFGPSDRFELIELKGLDEHEREREARLGREENKKSQTDDKEDKEDPLLGPEGKEISSVPHSESAEETRGGDKMAKTVTEAPERVNDTVSEAAKSKEVMLKAALEMDEFMLDGFDFSTGLSFFQGLDDDEESKAPNEVGNALMKVLKIGGEEKPSPNTIAKKADTILGVSSRPVNALTLDEIHARENIQTTPGRDVPNKPSNDDLGAFNKLVAGLQSSGAMPKETSKTEKYQTTQTKPIQKATTPSVVSPIPMPSTSSIPSTSAVRPEPQTTFGTILEKEMNFDDEIVTGAHPHYPPPPQAVPPQYQTNRGHRRVEHLERMLERLDQSHHTMFRDRHKATVPPEPSMHMTGSYPEQPMKKLMPNYGPRMPPGQMEGQRPYMVQERGEFVYPEGPGEMRMDMVPPPNIGIRPQGGVNRSGANNWAVEMERRRLYELKQMERARMGVYGDGMHPGMQQKMPQPKPNISLLPTAVMRQMHNTKPSQPISEVTKTSSVMTPRLDQDPSNKPSMTHSPISFNEPELAPPHLHPSHMYRQMGGGQVRGVPPLRPVSDPAAAAMMYHQRGYYNMPVMPHGGMHNPYMY